MTTLSTHTLQVLKNFAAINPNLEIKPGSKLSTIAEAKNIFANATIEETFESGFGIYDLNEFISVIGLVGSDATLDFKENHVFIKSETSGASARFRYANTSILTVPTKDITMPVSDVELTITEATLAQIRKASAALGHDTLSIKSEDGKLVLSVLDYKDPTANVYNLEAGDAPDGVTFDFQFLISNIKVIGGDYDISISSKLISEWSNAGSEVQYFIALEKTSTFA